MKVLAATQDFGFGPTSMLNRAINLLPSSWHVDVCAPPHLVGVFDERTNVDIFDSCHDARAFAVKGGYDAAVLACDYDLASDLYEALGKVVVFDMLFWFWPTINTVVSEDILVVAQDFYGVRERAARNSSVQVVGPLLPPVDPVPLAKREESFVVNLGGFTSPHNSAGDAASYARIIAPTIRMLLSRRHDLVIMGGATALEALGNVVPASRDRISLLHHDAARRKIAYASSYLTVPGLGSIYEPFLSGTPTFFLPPTNYTQALQLQALIDNLNYRWAMRFSSPRRGLDEETYISGLLGWYRDDCQSIASRLQDAVQIFMTSAIEERQGIVSESLALTDQFGGSGEESAGRALRSYLDR